MTKLYSPKASLLLPLLCLLFLSVGCSKESSPEQEKPLPTVSQRLAAEGNFELYLQALNLAGLSDELEREDITVLAPGDSVVAHFLTNRGVNDISALFQSMNMSDFRQLWQYSLIDAQVKGYDFKYGYLPTMALNRQGQAVYLYGLRHDQHISFNGGMASVLRPDLTCRNGIIHELDGVLSPATLRTLMRANPDLSTTFSLMSQSGVSLAVLLNQENLNHTLLAPANAAYDDLFGNSGMSFSDLSGMINFYGVQGLEELLSYHLLTSYHTAESFSSQSYKTLHSGFRIELEKEAGVITLVDGQQREVKVVLTNIAAVNGIMHTIDGVLLPN